MTSGPIPASPLSAQLKDLSDVDPLRPDEIEVLRDLRAVLARHGALDRFGVHLLHKHFDLAADEILVETADPEARTLVTRPQPTTDDATTIETSWTFGSDDDVAKGLINCWLTCRQFGTMHMPAHGPW